MEEIKKKRRLFRNMLGCMLFAGAAVFALASCANDAGDDDDYIADGSGDHYYGVSGGSSGSGAMTPAGGGGTSGGTTPTPTPSIAQGIAMKTGVEIKSALLALGADTGSGKSFSASVTPPPSGAATQLLSDVTESTPTEVLAWADASSNIKYYAQGYTDSGRKIPLNANSSEMFRGCEGLTSIDVTNFDTSNVITM